MHFDPPVHLPNKRVCLEKEKNEYVSKLRLEALPLNILNNIFQYVQSWDLLNLCCISRDLYWPAVNRIYRSITIASNYDFLWAYYHSSRWISNQGTVMSHKNVMKLLRTVQAKRDLGGMVKKLVLHKSIKSFDQKDVANVSYFLPNLTTWYNGADIGFIDKDHSVLQSVSCDVYRIPSKTINLVELRISDRNSRLVGEEYRLVAQSIIKLKGYEKLRSLHFAPSLVIDLENKPFGPYDVQDTPPHWLDFVVEFNLANVKLSLNSLGLSGNLTGRSREAVAIIRGGIDLGGVKELVLNIFEETNRASLSVLEVITKYTRLLESLAVHDTMGHRKNQKAAMSRAFRNNIPHQLKRLYVLFKTPKFQAAVYRKSNALTIAMWQRNLVEFKYEDGYDYVAADGLVFELKEMALEQAEFMKSAWSVELQKQQLFPRVYGDLHARPTISRNHTKFIEKSRGILQRCLENEMIDSLFPRYLPFLTQCYIGRVFIDPKRYGVYVNDGVVLFDRESRPTFDPNEPDMIEDYTPSD